MALLVSEHDGNSPKVWQPWYINAESEGVHKELPSRIHREQRIKDRTHLCKQSKSSPIMNNQKDLDPSYRRVYGPPEYTGNMHHTTSYSDDLPLDMSMKRRRHSPPPLVSIANSDDRLASRASPSAIYHHSAGHHPPSQAPLPMRSQSRSPRPYFRDGSDDTEVVRDRPSVITHASTRYHLHDYSPLPLLVPAAAESNSPPLPPPPSYSSATAYLREGGSTVTTTTTSSSSRGDPPPSSFQEAKKIRAEYPLSLPPVERPVEVAKSAAKVSAKKKLVQGSPVDPDIDEHFRRSLGTHYQQLFVSSTPEEDSDSNDSVDDHFTKALGETWRKLKASKVDAHVDRPSERLCSLQEARNAFGSQTPPGSVFEETADVSITRISLPSNFGHGS